MNVSQLIRKSLLRTISLSLLSSVAITTPLLAVDKTQHATAHVKRPQPLSCRRFAMPPVSSSTLTTPPPPATGRFSAASPVRITAPWAFTTSMARSWV